MTDGPLILVRFALYLVLMLLFGIALHGGTRNARSPDAGAISLRVPGGLLGLAAIALSGLSLALLAAGMSGVPLAELEWSSVAILLTGTSLGLTVKLRIAALIVALACALLAVHLRSLARWGMVAAGGVALATLAWTGHAAASEGNLGVLHMVADIVHLLAAGAWLGALAALFWRLFRIGASGDGAADLRIAHGALSRFSAAGTIIVGLIMITGLVNSFVLVGPANLLSLPSGRYGQLLLAKLALFLLMLALASSNRWRLTPRLEAALATGAHAGAVGDLRRSLLAETLAAVAILALVAWLGTLAPPMSGE